ncbi:MAG: IPT/TIG domain-containing protein [Nitrospiraceae bacterium]
MRKYLNSYWISLYLGGLVGLVATLLLVSGVDAKSSGAPHAKVTKAPACDYQSHPNITTVTPDPVKPGQKIVIKGSNFGTKQCFHNVSFGSTSANNFKYVSPTVLEATVPNLKPGLVPVNIHTEAGTSQFILMIQAK